MSDALRDRGWSIAVDVARTGITPGSPPSPIRLEPAAWESFVAHVVEQRLEGLSAAAVGSGWLALEPGQEATLRALRMHQVARVLRLDAELLATAQELMAQSVDVRVLKGAAFAHLVYDDASLRSYVDVDLLVRGDQFDAAASLLEARGGARRYAEARPGFDRTFSKGASFAMPSGVTIDLHRTLVLGPFGLTIDLDSLFAAPTEFEVAGATLRALSRPQMLVHAAIHAALGDWPPRLVPHLDLALLATEEQLALADVLDVARAWQVTAPLAHAIAASWGLFHLAETDLLRWAVAYRPSRTEARRIALYGPHRSYRRLALGSIAAIPGISSKAHYVRDLALPNRTYVASRQRSYPNRWREAAREAAARWRER